MTQSNTSELLEAACGKTETVTKFVEKFRANRFWSAGETAERNPPGGGNQHLIRRPMDLKLFESCCPLSFRGTGSPADCNRHSLCVFISTGITAHLIFTEVIIY